jgi:hypothetical protein
VPILPEESRRPQRNPQIKPCDTIFGTHTVLGGFADEYEATRAVCLGLRSTSRYLFLCGTGSQMIYFGPMVADMILLFAAALLGRTRRMARW